MRSWIDSNTDVNYFSVYSSTDKRIFSYRSSGATLPEFPTSNAEFTRRVMNSNLDILGR